MSTRPPPGSSHLAASTSPRKGPTAQLQSRSYHAGSRRSPHISRKMAYAFGSSTPRDFSYLDHVPYRYRVYDVPIDTSHHKHEHTLSEYIKEAHGRSRSRPRDRSLDSSLHRMYVFGSSTPRELSYMDKVNPAYRVYDVRLASAPPTTKRSKTTSFSSADKRYNTRRSSSVEQISRPPRKQVRSARTLHNAKLPPHPRPKSQPAPPPHPGAIDSPKREPAVEKVISSIENTAPPTQTSSASPIRQAHAELSEAKPLDHNLDDASKHGEDNSSRGMTKTISFHEDKREVKQWNDDDQSTTTGEEKDAQDVQEVVTRTYTTTVTSSSVSGSEPNPPIVFHEEKREVKQWSDDEKPPVSSTVFHEERREVQQWDDKQDSQQIQEPEEPKKDDDDPSLFERMSAALNEKLLGKSDEEDQSEEQKTEEKDAQDVQEVVTRTYTTTVTSSSVPVNEVEEAKEDEKKDVSLFDRMSAALTDKILGKSDDEEDEDKGGESHNVQEVVTRTYTSVTTSSSEAVPHSEGHNGETLTENIDGYPSPVVKIEEPDSAVIQGDAELNTGIVDDENERKTEEDDGKGKSSSSSSSNSSRKSSSTHEHSTAEKPSEF